MAIVYSVQSLIKYMGQKTTTDWSEYAAWIIFKQKNNTLNLMLQTLILIATAKTNDKMEYGVMILKFSRWEKYTTYQSKYTRTQTCQWKHFTKSLAKVA